MDQYTLFAIAAVVLATMRYGTYFYTIYKGQTKPHAFTWLLLGCVASVGAYASFGANAGPSAWAIAFVGLTCLLIAGFAFFIGERDYTKSDWAALIVCFLAIPIWKITDTPAIALVIVVIIDFWPIGQQSENLITSLIQSLQYRRSYRVFAMFLF